MTTPSQLFRKRLAENWQYQWKTWKMAIDWVIALYIIIPFGAAGIYIYWSWCTAPAKWFDLVPYNALVVVYVWILWNGSIRWFVEEGDLLFLQQRLNWMRPIRYRGFIYSLVKMVMAAASVIMVLLPMMRAAWDIHILQTSLLFVFLVAALVMMTAVRQWLEIQPFWRKWFGYACLLMISIMITWVYLQWIRDSLAIAAIASFLVVLGAVWVMWLRLCMKGTILYDIERDRKIKSRYAAMMVGVAIGKKPLHTRKKPLLFPRSATVLRQRTPANVLAETAAKTFFRSRQSVLTYLQFIGAGSVAVIFTPGWIRWIVWAALIFLISYWGRQVWKEYRQETFGKLYRFRSSDSRRGSRTMILLLVLPCCLLFSLEAAVAMSPVWYGWLALPGGVGLAWMAASMFEVYEV